MTDEEIILKHDPGVARDRARLELAIVNQLFESATKAGYRLYEGEEVGIVGPSQELKELLFDLDDAVVFVDDAATNAEVGWISLVFGNDGYDLISDYTVNLEEFLKDCDQLANRLEEELE